MQQQPRNKQIAFEAKRKQPYCSKCFKYDRLHAHHVVPLADGGSDTADNLDVICGHCHHDWHNYFEGVVSYDEFKAMPTVTAMVRMMAIKECEDQTLGGFRHQWTLVRDMYRRTV